MGSKKIILATFLLFLVSNVLTTIWYMLTDDANFVSFRREEINYLGLMMNHLIFVGGMIFFFPPYIKDQNTRASAFVFGAMMAIIMFLPTGMVVRSIWKVDFNAIFAFNAVAHSIIGGILGLTLHTIYNHKKVQK